jgi:hypothetical protein
MAPRRLVLRVVQFTPRARTPDPQLLLRGNERAAMTLNFMRSLVKGGFADLHHPEYFDLDRFMPETRDLDYYVCAATASPPVTVGGAFYLLTNGLYKSMIMSGFHWRRTSAPSAEVMGD